MRKQLNKHPRKDKKKHCILIFLFNGVLIIALIIAQIIAVLIIALIIAQ